ncbi:MAG: NYN domain-containing protein [Nocardioides sp.]|nr:NYN domain-containing protein [Nocardioides sp.]
MSSSDSDRVAVLIDADNTSPKHASALLEEVAKYGATTVKRAYGDWTTTQLGGWKSKLNQLAIQPMQQFAYTTGKNSTDSALIIDAMDLLYSGNVDAFAIVSSDSDFTRLATRLRESGMKVIGLGLRKTPQSLVSACDRFVYLELLDADPVDAAPEVERETGEAPARLPDLQRLLVHAVTSASHDDGWASLSAVGSHISRSHPSFDPRNHGATKLVDLVRAQGYLDVEQPESGPVRLRLAPKSGRRRSARDRSEPPAQPVETRAETRAEPEVEQVTEVVAPKRTRKRTASAVAPAVAPAAEPAAQPAVQPTAGATPEPAAEAVTKTTRKRTSTRKSTSTKTGPEPVAALVPEPETPKVTTRRRGAAAKAGSAS